MSRIIKAIFSNRVQTAERAPCRRPDYPEMGDRTPAMCHVAPSGETQWYPPVMIGAAALGNSILEPRQVELARELLEQLEPDDYLRYMIRFYRDGLQRFGAHWGFADIVTVLLSLAQTMRPRRYLEIGVRRGRSACAVGWRAPDCEMVLFDMWVTNYAGMENPGPELVRRELKKLGHRAPVTFIDGDSHATLPRYFRDHGAATFDLITVDGDHSDSGAAQDLRDVLPRLAIGGAIVFDDVCHPQHPGLRQVWRNMIESDPRFSAWTYDEVGYGVAFAVRKW